MDNTDTSFCLTTNLPNRTNLSFLSNTECTEAHRFGNGGVLMWFMHALKGQPLHSPGQAKRHPGICVDVGNARPEGAKVLRPNYLILYFCPYRARVAMTFIKPRVPLRLPWAMEYRAFSPSWRRTGLMSMRFTCALKGNYIIITTINAAALTGRAGKSAHQNHRVLPWAMRSCPYRASPLHLKREC